MREYGFLREQAGQLCMGIAMIVCYSLSVSSVSAQEADIEGTVVLEHALTVPSGINFGRYQNITSVSRFEAADSTSDSILIWLEDKNTKAYYENPDTVLYVLDQINKRFKPRLMAIRIGDFVRIKNSDPLYHNVFSLSKTKKFDVGRRPPGDYEDVRFDKAGIVDVFCDIHSDMHAVIRVLPEYTVTMKKLRGSGSFQFKNVPEGEYRLIFFALGNRRERIDIKVAGSEKITLETIRLGRRL